MIDGDGCSSRCLVELGYMCQASADPGNVADTCLCDPEVLSATWINNWGAIRIVFRGRVSISADSLGAPVEPNGPNLCGQILEAAVVSVLGASYSCVLESEESESVFVLNIGNDGTLGGTTPTTLKISHLKRDGCSLALPTDYHILNPPLPEPQVVFESSESSNAPAIPMCSSSFIVDVLKSKGLTSRDFTLSWTVSNLDPPDGALQTTTATLLASNFNNKM